MRLNSPCGARGIICDIFYIKEEHIAPGCTLTVREQGRVLENFESLEYM